MFVGWVDGWPMLGPSRRNLETWHGHPITWRWWRPRVLRDGCVWVAVPQRDGGVWAPVLWPYACADVRMQEVVFSDWVQIRAQIESLGLDPEEYRQRYHGWKSAVRVTLSMRRVSDDAGVSH